MSSTDGDGPNLAGARWIGPDPHGATPLDEEDLAELLPTFVATRADLNLVEFDNIARATPWAFGYARRRGPEAVLEYGFVFTLHRRMFGEVWRWAGTQRRRTTNLGVDPAQIAVLTTQALDDARYWHEHEVFDADERAARLHHRLVAIHPFPNGNGRCTRLLADLYLTSIGAPTFTWGARGGPADPEASRQRYLGALRAADGGSYEQLVEFARS